MVNLQKYVFRQVAGVATVPYRLLCKELGQVGTGAPPEALV